MLENARVTAFTVSELSRLSQHEGKTNPPRPTQIRVKWSFSKIFQQQKEASFSNEFVFLISPKIALRDG